MIIFQCELRYKLSTQHRILIFILKKLTNMVGQEMNLKIDNKNYHADTTLSLESNSIS